VGCACTQRGSASATPGLTTGGLRLGTLAAMNDTARLRTSNPRVGARTAPEPAGPPRPGRPSAHRDAPTSVDQRDTDAGRDRWSPALTLGLALASPQTALLVARLLGPRDRRGHDA
jgi:hypothetical protein